MLSSFLAGMAVFAWVGWVCSQPQAVLQASQSDSGQAHGVSAAFRSSAPSSDPSFVGAGRNTCPRESFWFCAGITCVPMADGDVPFACSCILFLFLGLTVLLGWLWMHRAAS